MSVLKFIVTVVIAQTLAFGLVSGASAAELIYKHWYKACRGSLCAVAMRANPNVSVIIFSDSANPGTYPGTTIVWPDIAPGTNVYWQFGARFNRVPPSNCSSEFCQAPIQLDEQFIRGLKAGGMGLFIEVTRGGDTEKTKFSLLDFAKVWDGPPMVGLSDLMAWVIPQVTYL